MSTATIETLELTYDEAVELLDRAVAEKGADFVYDRGPDGHDECLYLHGNEPGCIVGHVLVYKGVDLELIRELEGIGVWSLDEYLPQLKTDGRTRRLLGAAQGKQDSGQTWGDSVAKAKAEVR
jgi:hypothetical protein